MILRETIHTTFQLKKYFGASIIQKTEFQTLQIIKALQNVETFTITVS